MLGPSYRSQALGATFLIHSPVLFFGLQDKAEQSKCPILLPQWHCQGISNRIQQDRIAPHQSPSLVGRNRIQPFYPKYIALESCEPVSERLQMDMVHSAIAGCASVPVPPLHRIDRNVYLVPDLLPEESILGYLIVLLDCNLAGSIVTQVTLFTPPFLCDIGKAIMQLSLTLKSTGVVAPPLGYKRPLRPILINGRFPAAFWAIKKRFDGLHSGSKRISIKRSISTSFDI